MVLAVSSLTAGVQTNAGKFGGNLADGCAEGGDSTTCAYEVDE